MSAAEIKDAAKPCTFLALVFGRHITTADSTGHVVVSEWRGVTYLLQWQPACEHGYYDWSECPDCGH